MKAIRFANRTFVPNRQNRTEDEDKFKYNNSNLSWFEKNAICGLKFSSLKNSLIFNTILMVEYAQILTIHLMKTLLIFNACCKLSKNQYTIINSRLL